MELKPNPQDPIFLQCFDTAGWVIWPIKTCPQHVQWDVKPYSAISHLTYCYEPDRSHAVSCRLPCSHCSVHRHPLPLTERNGLGFTAVAASWLDVSHRLRWRAAILKGFNYFILGISHLRSDFKKMWNANQDHYAQRSIAFASMEKKGVENSVGKVE